MEESITESLVKLSLDDINYNTWNKWTKKSMDVQFKSSGANGIGDGEEKLAVELGVELLGQNSDYDFKFENKRCEVKKLDKGTFNTGKIGRIKYSDLRKKIEMTLENYSKFTDYCVDNSLFDLNSLTELSDSIRSIVDLGELCESKCKRNGLLHQIFTQVHLIKETLKTDSKIDAYNIFGEEVELSPEQFLVLGAKQSIGKDRLQNRIGVDGYKKAEALNILDENLMYLFSPDYIITDFESLTTIFNDITLFFVDETKGFYPMTHDQLSRIKFCRITRGNPRFQVDLDSN